LIVCSFVRSFGCLLQVCSQKNDTLLALQHLVNQASEVIEWVPEDAAASDESQQTSSNTAAAEKLEIADIDLLLQESFSFLTTDDANNNDSGKPDVSLKDGRVVAPMMRILSS